MAVVMARLLRNGERVFHGVASPLPMVAILLAKRLHAPTLVYLNIAGSVDPAPVSLTKSSTGPALLAGSATLVTLADLFDLSARGELHTAFLSAVQIDGAGRINMSVIGDFDHPKVRLPGGAGSAPDPSHRPAYYPLAHAALPPQPRRTAGLCDRGRSRRSAGNAALRVSNGP